MIFRESYILNIYSLILLLILLFTMILKKETYRYSSRILKTVMILISIQLVIEIFSWAFDTIDKPYARILNYGFNLIFFLFGAVIIGAFFCYVDYLVYKSRERLKKRYYYMHLLAFFSILAIINIFTPILFSISETNIYQREFGLNIAFFVVFITLFYVLMMAYKNRHKIDKSIYLSIFVFGTIPFIGGLLQMVFYGLLIMWAFVGLSISIAYIFTERINSSKDHLTQLYTREISEEFILQLLDSKKDAMVILFDIDSLKYINDAFGHKTGDRALVLFSKALTLSFPKTALVSRFGGDEFIVALKDDEYNQHPSYLEMLSNIISNTHLEGFQLNYSYGIASTKQEKINDIKTLIHACDIKMYEQKALHKSQK